MTEICYSELSDEYWSFENTQNNTGQSGSVSLIATGSISYVENDYQENAILIPSGSQLTFDVDVPTYGVASGSTNNTFLEMRYKASAGSNNVRLWSRRDGTAWSQGDKELYQDNSGSIVLRFESVDLGAGSTRTATYASDTRDGQWHTVRVIFNESNANFGGAVTYMQMLINGIDCGTIFDTLVDSTGSLQIGSSILPSDPFQLDYFLFHSTPSEAQI